MKKFWGAAACGVLAAGLLATPAIAAPGGHHTRGSLTFTSAAGDWVGGGTRGHYSVGTRRGVTTTMTVKTLYAWDNSITVTVVQGAYDHWWYLDLAAADGKVLTAGRYTSAMREPFKDAGHPGLDFSGDGRGCNRLFGEFNVHRLVRASDGHVTKLDVDFVQHCETVDAPTLRGHLRYAER